MKEKKKIQFKDYSHLLEKNGHSSSYGVAIFDIDGDDEPEILVSNSLSSNIIYKFNDATGTFVDVAPKNFKAKDKATLCMCVGDFTGTGVASVYMLHSDTVAGLKSHYDNLFLKSSTLQTDLAFTDLFLDFPNMSNPYAGRSVVAVDRLGTGKHGFYVVNYDAPNLFYELNTKTMRIEEFAKKLNLDQKTFGRSVIAQYITNDKAVDFFVGNEHSANSFLTKSSKNSYSEISSDLNLADQDFNSRGLAVADFDGNGLTDIVLGTWNGLNSIFMQKTAGEFRNLPPAFFGEPRNIRSIIVADFDNDGHEEIFVNVYKKRNKMFRYLGHNEWEEISIGDMACPDFCATGAAIGDLTGNGFLDIFMTSDGYKQENKLFLGVPNQNNWLRIQPLTQNGFPALGSKVRVFCKGARNQTKFICSGSGYLCQMEPVAHFGFGADDPVIDYVEITWPGNGVRRPAKAKILGSKLQLKTFVKIPHPSII